MTATPAPTARTVAALVRRTIGAGNASSTTRTNGVVLVVVTGNADRTADREVLARQVAAAAIREGWDASRTGEVLTITAPEPTDDEVDPRDLIVVDEDARALNDDGIDLAEHRAVAADVERERADELDDAGVCRSCRYHAGHTSWCPLREPVERITPDEARVEARRLGYRSVDAYLDAPGRNVEVVEPTPMRLRNVRVRDELWDAAVDRAVREGRSISGVIREALTAYAAG